MMLERRRAAFSSYLTRLLSDNIDFGTITGGNLPNTYGARAGQIGDWNQIPGINGIYVLSDLSGTTTGATLTLGGTEGSESGGGTEPSWPQEDKGLFGDAFQANINHPNPAFRSGLWSISISGLSDGDYDIWVYASARDDFIATGPYSINGAAQPELLGGGNSLLGRDFWVAETVVVGGLLVLDQTAMSSRVSFGTNWAGVAGLQIVAIPIPAALPLFAAGIGLLGFIRREKGGDFYSP
jgi:hypothetical protein